MHSNARKIYCTFLFDPSMLYCKRVHLPIAVADFKVRGDKMCLDYGIEKTYNIDVCLYLLMHDTLNIGCEDYNV